MAASWAREKARSPEGWGLQYTSRTGWGQDVSTHGSSRLARCRVFGAAILTLALVGGPAGAEEWTVKTVPRTDGPGTRCIMESVRQSLSDGYQDTTAYVTVDARSVTVTSASNLDGSFSDIGLVIDQEPPVPMDRLAGIKTAQFDAKYGRLVELFKAVASVSGSSSGWGPEWPATGTHSATFSLIGFTKATASWPAVGRGPRRGGRHGAAPEVQPGSAAGVPGGPWGRRGGSRAISSSAMRGTRSRGMPA